jgi:hypothetical protein
VGMVGKACKASNPRRRFALTLATIPDIAECDPDTFFGRVQHILYDGNPVPQFEGQQRSPTAKKIVERSYIEARDEGYGDWGRHDHLWYAVPSPSFWRSKITTTTPSAFYRAKSQVRLAARTRHTPIRRHDAIPTQQQSSGGATNRDRYRLPNLHPYRHVDDAHAAQMHALIERSIRNHFVIRWADLICRSRLSKQSASSAVSVWRNSLVARSVTVVSSFRLISLALESHYPWLQANQTPGRTTISMTSA